MACGPFTFHSPALGKDCSMTVILPERQEREGPFPVWYLLHGLGDDHTVWCRRTSIERYVAELPLIVVMPDAGRSFYCDAVEGPPYETYIIQDVIGFVDRFFHTMPSRAGRVIGGLSMGAYGAIKLALKFPGMFSSVTAHSGVYATHLENEQGRMDPEWRRIFGPSPRDGMDDPFALAERIDHNRLPAIRLDCGIQDDLLTDSRALHGHLARLGIPHQYEEFPGGHTWEYWDAHVQDAVLFHRRVLGI